MCSLCSQHKTSGYGKYCSQTKHKLSFTLSIHSFRISLQEKSSFATTQCLLSSTHTLISYVWLLKIVFHRTNQMKVQQCVISRIENGSHRMAQVSSSITKKCIYETCCKCLHWILFYTFGQVTFHVSMSHFMNFLLLMFMKIIRLINDSSCCCYSNLTHSVW
jgi:hypothetical protein